MERGAVAELPALIPIPVLRMNGQHRRRLTVTSDEVFSRSEREGRLLHQQAVLLDPPVCAVELPLRRSDATDGLQSLVAAQRNATRARIQAPQPPRLCEGP